MRGIFERPKGSGVWWASYFDAEGKRRREKIGRKSDAIKTYQIRRAAVTEGRKLPTVRHRKGVLLSDLIDLALEFTIDHRDRRSYISKAEIVRADLGTIPASDLTPQQIDRWLTGRKKSAATANRYKAFLSLCFREGIRNGKVDTNPARSVRQRKESGGRLRFLSHEEYDRLHSAVARLFPEHLAEFVVSVNAGLRLTEQYSCKWSWLDLGKRTIRLPKTLTKNGQPRTVHLNGDAVRAIESFKVPGQKSTEYIFPRQGTKAHYDIRSWFVPCLAAAEIEGYIWHSNRHTFCSWLAMAGATIKEVQEAAGHLTIAMSARYAHLSPAHTKSVVERIEIANRNASATFSASATNTENEVAPKVVPA